MSRIIALIKKHKSNIVKAAIWAFLMIAVFTVFYVLKSKNEFYVSAKNKLLILGCVGLSTLLFLFRIQLPKWVGAIGEAVVILLTPVWLFNILEPVVNGMESFVSEARSYNIVIIFAVFLALYAITQHAGITVGLGSLIVYVLYLVDYFTIAFRGTPFILSDILSAKTAAGVMGNYKFVLSAHIMEIFYIGALITAFGFFFTVRKKKLPIRLALAGVSLIASVGIFTFMLSGNHLENKGFNTSPFIPIASAEANGFPLNTIVSLKASFIEAPAGYSTKAVNEIIANYSTGSKDASADYVRPNIIVIMNESFTDFDYLETVQTTEPTIPKFKALKDNCVKGTLVSSIYGGNTPNSEFELLTGCSLAFLPQGIVAFQQIISEPLPTLTTMLEEQGYSSSAIHLYNPEYFSRSRIYPLLGFDEFININNTTVDVELFYDYAYDRCSYDAVKQSVDKSADPHFSFCVTIQNHGGYWHWLRDILVTNANSDYANDYSSLLKIADDAFADLLEYYSNVDEPTIIVMFGDHQPNLFDDFYDAIWDGCDYTDTEKYLMKQKVPFVIWANYDIEEKDMGTMSINYLGPTILKTAGLPMSDFYKYLDNLRETLPVISGVGYIDKDGNYFTETDNEEYKALLREYQYLQYNYLKGNSKSEFYR